MSYPKQADVMANVKEELLPSMDSPMNIGSNSHLDMGVPANINPSLSPLARLKDECSDESRNRSYSCPVLPPLVSAIGTPPTCVSPLQGTPSSPGTASVPSPNSKTGKKSPRRNPWGPESYADLISKAIMSSKDQRMTLNQIYEWMVEHVAHFKDKGDSNSAAGWKNSVRHNLSLHPRFTKVPNEQTGKSNWWVINPEAKRNRRTRSLSLGGEAMSSSPVRGRRHPSISRPKKLSKAGKQLKGDDGSASSLITGSHGSPFSPGSLSSPLLDNPLSSNSPGGPIVDPPMPQDEYDPNSPMPPGIFMNQPPGSFPGCHFDIEPHPCMALSGSEGSTTFPEFLAPTELLMPDQEDQLAANTIPTFGVEDRFFSMNIHTDGPSATYRSSFNPCLTPVKGTPWDTPLANCTPRDTPHHTPPPHARHNHHHNLSIGAGRQPPFVDPLYQDSGRRGEATDRPGVTGDGRVGNQDIPDRTGHGSQGQFQNSQTGIPTRGRSVSEPAKSCSYPGGIPGGVSDMDMRSPPPLTAIQPDMQQQEGVTRNNLLFIEQQQQQQQQQQHFLSVASTSSVPSLNTTQPPSYQTGHSYGPGQPFFEHDPMSRYMPQDIAMAMNMMQDPDVLMPFPSSIAVPPLSGSIHRQPHSAPDLQRSLNGGLTEADMDGLFPAGTVLNGMEFALPQQQQFAPAPCANGIRPNAAPSSNQSPEMQMQLEFSYDHFAPPDTTTSVGSYSQPSSSRSSTSSTGSSSWLPRRLVK